MILQKKKKYTAEHYENEDEENLRGKVKPPLQFYEEFGYHCINVNYCDAKTPENFQEATTCKDSNKWKEAMDREMDSLVKNKRWVLIVKPPKNKKVIDVKWIYKTKSKSGFKARLVVRGFEQTDCLDNT